MSRQHAIEYVPPMLVLFAWACAVLTGVAHCGPTPEAKAAAEAAYTAALLGCVNDASTLADSKSCRATVDKAFGVSR